MLTSLVSFCISVSVTCVKCIMQVISGQNLPKPGGAKEIIDPYVVLQFLGAHDDNKSFKTKVINDNGNEMQCT